MHLYFHLFAYKLASYGLLLSTGIIFANIIAYFIIKKQKLDFNDFIIIESSIALAAIIGAKVLYLIISYKQINWSELFNPNYLNKLMSGGFVFYGGIIASFLPIYLIDKKTTIDIKLYIKKFIFLVPLAHAFGRIGCFMAGCCYGIPYSGHFAVVFPSGSIAPAGIPLFPIQLVEAASLLILSIILYLLIYKFNYKKGVSFYLFNYACLRFILEFFRFDSIRGHFGLFSSSQWISLAIIIILLSFHHNDLYKL